MRRILSSLAVSFALLTTPLLANAQDSQSADASSAESSSSSSDSSSSASSPSNHDGGMRGDGGLFDTADHHRKHMLSAFAYTPFDVYRGLGIGAALRYTLPIVPNGFISKLNDSFALEMGGDFYYGWHGYYGYSYGYLSVVVPAVEARWSFHFTKRWEAYGKAGVGFQLRHFTDAGGPPLRAIDWVYINVAVGGLMHINDVLALRAEVGYGGLRVGIGFGF